MKQKNLFLALVFFAFATSLKAQNCDPWIADAYKMMYKRTPTAAECNIKNYNNGSWRNKAELIGYIDAYNRYKPGDFLKGDPWIFQAYYELYNRIPNPIELNVNLYNGGSWNDLGQLKGYIQEYQKSLTQNNVRMISGKVKDKDVAAIVDNNNNVLAVSLVSLNNGQVISPGGGNVISAGGDNVISPGGGNMTFNNNTAGLTIGSGYSTQSTGVKRVIKTAGKGTIAIK